MSGSRLGQGRPAVFLTWMLLATFVAASALAGCNTLRGAGEDVEDAGEAVQDTFD